MRQATVCCIYVPWVMWAGIGGGYGGLGAMNKCLICSDSGQIRNGTSDISSMVGENFVSFCESLPVIIYRFVKSKCVRRVQWRLYTGNTCDDITLWRRFRLIIHNNVSITCKKASRILPVCSFFTKRIRCWTIDIPSSIKRNTVFRINLVKRRRVIHCV